MNEDVVPIDESLPVMRHSTSVILDASLVGSIGADHAEAKMRISGALVVFKETTLLGEPEVIVTVTP